MLPSPTAAAVAANTKEKLLDHRLCVALSVVIENSHVIDVYNYRYGQLWPCLTHKGPVRQALCHCSSSNTLHRSMDGLQHRAPLVAYSASNQA